MSIEEYKQTFLELFKEMQDEFGSNIRNIHIWHHKSWIDNENKVHPDEYEISIDFSD
jgi:hypothetical protein